MAKKTSIKVRLVPEAKPDSPFFYYVKKPNSGEKAKVKLKIKKYNPATRKHEMFVEKKLPPHSKSLFFFKNSLLKIHITPNHRFPYSTSCFSINSIFYRFVFYIF